MSRLASLTAGSCSLLIALTVSAQELTGVEVGKNLPGSFQPYNINVAVPLSVEPEPDPKDKGEKRAKYTSKGKFHCLVSEYDLDPVLMLVARGLEDSDGLEDSLGFRDLLTKLDAALDKNKIARLRCFVVFQKDDLEDVITKDDKRDEAVKKLDELVAATKLAHVVVSLAGKDDLAKYKLDPTVALTAILYKKLRVEAIHKVGKEKLDAADGPEVKAILSDVGTKLGAAR